MENLNLLSWLTPEEVKTIEAFCKANAMFSKICYKVVKVTDTQILFEASVNKPYTLDELTYRVSNVFNNVNLNGRNELKVIDFYDIKEEVNEYFQKTFATTI